MTPVRIPIPHTITLYDFDQCCQASWALAEHFGVTVPIWEVPKILARLAKEQEAAREVPS